MKDNQLGRALLTPFQQNVKISEYLLDRKLTALAARCSRKQNVQSTFSRPQTQDTPAQQSTLTAADMDSKLQRKVDERFYWLEKARFA